MPNLFGSLLANVNSNWQQNGRIPSIVMQDVIILLTKDTDNGDVLGNFQPITLLNADFKILAKVLVKRLVFIIGSLIKEAQMCAIPSRSIHNNLHLMWYIVERAGTKTDFDGSLMNFDQLKAFDR